jgi:chromosome segregation ATPase
VPGEGGAPEFGRQYARAYCRPNSGATVLSGLVILLTAAEARISRLEKQVEAERDRVNEARSEVDRLRGEVTDLTARADQAEQASTLADTARQEAVQVTAALRRADADRKARGLVARLRAAWRGE